MMYPGMTTPVTYNNPFASVTPMNYQVPQPQITQGPQLIRINGIESARAFQTQPNATYALFDENDDIMYIKQTDASNFPTIRTFRFTEIKENQNESHKDFVTKEEFDKLREELNNVKQLIQQPAYGGKWYDGPKPDITCEASG